MTTPQAQVAVEAFAKRLASLEGAATSSIVDAYAPVWQRLQRDITKLLEVATKEGLTSEQTLSLNRYQILEKRFLRNVDEFAQVAGSRITEAQRASVGLAQVSTQATLRATLPEGVTLDMLARLGIDWNEIPTEAFANFVGIAGDGQPVGNLLMRLGPETAVKVKAEVGTGIALGRGPRATAEIVRQVAGMPLSKALLITRTETNRAYREASRLQYAANPNLVKGYRRLAAKDERTCMACIALDGKFYETNEPLDEHPNGRCTLVPETLTYRDLGLDVDMPEVGETASQWFDNLPAAKQRKMMGTKGYTAFSQGRAGLSDFVQVSESRVWGKSATVANVS